jgi:hypothetical protein
MNLIAEIATRHPAKAVAIISKKVIIPLDHKAPLGFIYEP